MAKTNIMAWGVVALVVIAGVFLAQSMGWIEPAATEQPTGPEQPAIAGCQVEDSTVTFQAIDKYNSGTAIGGNHQYRVVSEQGPGIWTAVANAGSATLSPGQELEIVWGQGNASAVDTSVANAMKETVTIPCQGALTLSAELTRNNSLTTRVFNEEGNLVSTTENETIGTGEVVTLDGDFAQTFEFAYDKGGIVTVEYNSSVYDKVDVAFAGASNSVAVPSWKTVSATDNTLRAFNAPEVISSQPRVPFAITLDAKSAVDPAQSGVASGTASYNGDVEVCYINEAVYLNNDNNEYEFAVEDEDGAQTGAVHCFLIEID